ncbi:MAG: DivIVA domain-containing protein [Candidatus Latescibacterota bacterium]
MNLSPLEIRKHEFRKKFRGFDPDEVAAFLDIVSMEYENLVHQTSMLNEKLVMMESQLKKYRTMETTLQETLLSAERSREDTLKTAKKQAEIVIREAEVRAASIIDEGQHALVRLRNTFSELKMHKDTYLAKLKALVTAQAELFKQYSFAEERAFEKVEERVELSGEERRPAQPQPRRTPLQKIEDEIIGNDIIQANRFNDEEPETE